MVLKELEWEQGAPAPVGRYGHTAVWLNGLVYVGGGTETEWKASYRIDCYDPVNNLWSSPIKTPYCRFAMTTLNNNLLVAGGWDKNSKTTNQILSLDTGQTQLRDYTKMNKPRAFATAAGHQGILIITGGKDDKYKTLSSTEMFDSNSKKWYTCNDLIRPHCILRSVIVDDSLYLLGGLNEDVNPSPEIFSTPLEALPRYQLMWNTHQDTPLCYSAPVSVGGTHLLIVGGGKKIKNDFTRTSDVYKLNKATCSWEIIGHIPSARSSSAAVSTADNRIIVIGGENNEGKVTNTVWIGFYDPQ